jgi:RNA-directed DNA polymerase
VKRDGRQEVRAARSTGEVGELTREDPMEGRGSQETEPLERKMEGTKSPQDVSTKLQRIAELARRRPSIVFTTLAHHIDVEFLRIAHQRTRKDGAVGVDQQSSEEYALHLEDNLRALLDRFKAGTYWAPPVRRVHIPKGDGSKTRPIGVPTFEDKLLQRAVTMVLEAVYEQDFLECSYGFRPYRSAHQALEDVRSNLMKMKGGWVLEVDIEKFFDSIDHGHLRSFLDQRVRDGVIRRQIDKWLKAGVLEEGQLHYPDAGSPQGGVVSPVLANIYLHEVLDKWFAEQVVPKLNGFARLVRYADDFVVLFEREDDARRVLGVLPKRFGKYGLSLHPTKTRLLPFKKPPRSGGDRASRTTFDLLGFTHFWRKSHRGGHVVGRKTARDRLRRALKRVGEWCKRNRHESVADQQRALNRKLVGHYGYFGISGNSRGLRSFVDGVRRLWHKWLNRRSGRKSVKWDTFVALLKRYPLARPRLVQPYRLAANP